MFVQLKAAFASFNTWLHRKRDAQKVADARAGKTTSGFLSPGERQRMFRNRQK